jgi:hypothetical protein
MLKRGEQGTCRGPVEVVLSVFKQCVTLCLSHTLSHTYTHIHTHTRGQATCWKDGRRRSCRRHLRAQCFKRQGHGWLKASSGADSDAFLESSAWIQSPDHISRRCSKTSKCIRNIEKVWKAGICIESTMGRENKNQLGTWNRSKQDEIAQFESIQVSFL